MSEVQYLQIQKKQNQAILGLYKEYKCVHVSPELNYAGRFTLLLFNT